MEVYLVEEVLFLLLGRYRFGRVGSIVAQDGRVDAVREINIAEVGVRADPVVINGLVRSELENEICRHSLTSKLEYTGTNGVLTTKEYR